MSADDGWTTVVGKRKGKKATAKKNEEDVERRRQEDDDNVLVNDDNASDDVGDGSKPILRHDGQKPIVKGYVGRGNTIKHSVATKPPSSVAQILIPVVEPDSRYSTASTSATTVTDAEIRANERRRVQLSDSEIIDNRELPTEEERPRWQQEDNTKLIYVNVNKRKNWEAHERAEAAAEALKSSGIPVYNHRDLAEPTAMHEGRIGRSGRHEPLPAELKQKMNRAWNDREPKNPEQKRRAAASSPVVAALK